jgi:glycosyltransferase involved in cell wall biosynthesis
VKRRVVLLTEIIAPYRTPVFNALARCADIDLEVVFLAENDPSLRQWEVYKDEISFRYEVLPSWRKRLGKHNVLLNSGLSATLEKARPDAVICGGYNYLASWQSLFWARQRKIPFVAWVESNARDHRSGDRATEFLKGKFLRSCAAVIVPGKSSFGYVRGYSVPEEIIFTAPNAVDTELFARNAEEARRRARERREELGLPPRFFLYVGRLVPEKGVFELLHAYGTLSQDLKAQIGLVFVGDGAARASLVRDAPDGVQFVGFAQRDQLSNYYGLADALVFPTHSDPWGLVVNEAMACGLPIIASDAAGCVADLVTDGWNGRVVAPSRVEDLASAMTELAQDQVLRTTMGNHSRERISAYSPEACAAGMASAVISLVRARHE